MSSEQSVQVGSGLGAGLSGKPGSEVSAKLDGELGSGPLDRYALMRLVRDAGERLRGAGVASPEVDARLLAEHLLGTSLVLSDAAPVGFEATYGELVSRRAQREPLQHITGEMYFLGHRLMSRPGVFVVRPETEVLAQSAIEAGRAQLAAHDETPQAGASRPGSGAALRDGAAEERADSDEADRAEAAQEGGLVVVDLCTGSGALAIALAAALPEAQAHAADVNPLAVELARENAEAIAPGRVEIVLADATAAETLAELDGRVDVVVSNPPYVPSGEIEDEETLRYDPPLALFGGGEDGLEVPRAIIARVANLLAPGGEFFMEHDPRQSEALRAAATELGLQARTERDLTGRDRYLRARKPLS